MAHETHTGGGGMNNLFEIVMKLVGPVAATGQHNEDLKRFDNLGELIELTDRLLLIVTDVSKCANREEASISAIGKRAKDFLRDVSESLEEYTK
jgi:hypothetical protein